MKGWAYCEEAAEAAIPWTRSKRRYELQMSAVY